MSRSILKKSGPMRVPRDDVQVDTKDEVKESEEDQCQSAGGEAEASVPDTSGEDRKEEPQKPFKNKNLKAKDSMRLSSNRLGSSPRSRFLQKRKESGSSPRLLKIKEGEHTFTYPESVRADPVNMSGDTQERMSVKDTSHRKLQKDTVDITPSTDSVHRTSGTDTEHKTSEKDTVDRALDGYPVHTTSGKDAEHKKSKKDTVDRALDEYPVHRISGKDAEHKTPKEDTIDSEPGKDPVHTTSGKNAEHKTSKKDTVDRALDEYLVHRTSGKDAEHKTSRGNNVDFTRNKDSVHRPLGKDAEHKSSKKDTVDREPGKDNVDREPGKDNVDREPGKDTEHKTSKKDTVDRALDEYPVHRTSGKDAEHKTSRENNVDITQNKDSVHRPPGKDAEHKTPKEDTIDREPGKDPVDRTSGKDSTQKTPKDDTVNREPGKDPVQRSSGNNAEHKTSSEDNVDKKPGKHPVHRSSGNNAEHKTSSEDNVDKKPGKDPVDRSSGKDAEHKTSSEDNVDKKPGKDPVHRSSGKDAEHKTSKENTESRTHRSDESCHTHVPIVVEENGKTVPHLHTTSVTKSLNKTQIEEHGMDVASGGEGSVTEVFVRADVVAEDQDTSSCGYLTGGSHDEVDNPDSIVSEPDNFSHVESEKYAKGTMEVQALLKECPSPKDKIEHHVLPTDNPSLIVELQDRPAVGDGSKGDGEETLSIVGHMPTNIVEVEAVTIVDIHPHATFHAHVDNVEDVLPDVPFSEETVGVPVVPAADQIPPNTEQVQGLPALEPFQKDVQVEDLSDSTSQTSSSTVSSLLDGTDRECHKENIIPSRPVLDMGNSVPEEFGVEQSQHSNGKTDNTPTSDTDAKNNAEEDAWSFSDDECFV